MSNAMLRLLAALVSLLSWRAAGRVGAALGLLWYRVLRIRRRVVAENLELALPGRASQHAEIARESYRNTGANGLELIRMSSMAPAEIAAAVETEGMDRYEEVLDRGRGVIVVTAHMGNFDLLACSQASAGVPLAIVSRELSSGGTNRFWMETRRRTGLEIFSEDNALRGSLRWLREGKVLGLVVDQRTPPSRGGARIPFLGVPAWTPTLAARLALRTGAALLPVRMERLGKGRHRMVVEEEIPAVGKAASREEDVLALTGEINRRIEGWVRRAPGVWMWLHRRFIDEYK